MIPIGVFGYLQFFLLFICPFLGVLSVLILILKIIDFFYDKYLKKMVVKPFFSKKIKIYLLIFLVLNVWNIYVFIGFKGINEEIYLKNEYKDQRSRFILPVDYIFDGFKFPQGTLINSYNIHDDGERYRYLTLSGLKQARFPKSIQIANVWVSAIKIDSDYSFLVQLSQDQRISSVYKLDEHGEYKIDITHPPIDCKKDQIAEFAVNSDYYLDKNYEIKDWYTIEDERFEPQLWLFKGCFTAPPIFVEHPYPQTKLFDIERMSEVTVSPY